MRQPSNAPHEYDIAQNYHDRYQATVLESYKATVTAGGAALKLLATMNAGGIIAILGFLGTIAGKGALTTAQPFEIPLTYFAFGLISAAVASGGMYIAQALFTIGAASIDYPLDYPFVRAKPRQRRFKIAGRIIQALTIFLAIAALALFIYGLATALSPLTSLKLQAPDFGAYNG